METSRFRTWSRPSSTMSWSADVSTCPVTRYRPPRTIPSSMGCGTVFLQVGGPGQRLGMAVQVDGGASGATAGSGRPRADPGAVGSMLRPTAGWCAVNRRTAGQEITGSTRGSSGPAAPGTPSARAVAWRGASRSTRLS
ncbi:hypothetical protein ACFFX0_17065 [Citricoccus parietis]|uniref:Uncharacterized protein n=1 Tax=Citricoccus parietis TaxID=592307 RepID=A0ABV5G1K1_9MICC